MWCARAALAAALAASASCCGPKVLSRALSTAAARNWAAEIVKQAHPVLWSGVGGVSEEKKRPREKEKKRGREREEEEEEEAPPPPLFFSLSILSWFLLSAGSTPLS